MGFKKRAYWYLPSRLVVRSGGFGPGREGAGTDRALLNIVVVVVVVGGRA